SDFGSNRVEEFENRHFLQFQEIRNKITTVRAVMLEGPIAF
ncbi:hypothetical protein LCGC14_1378940, partial [marine sediment metagenome]